jgi:hypothetical protein
MTGNHLIVYPDGRFGCVVYAGATKQARMHRRMIIALVGDVESARRMQKRRSDAQVVLKPWWL